MKFYIPIATIFLINSVASEVCYAGGMKDHPLSANTEQPPCWYKSEDGTYSCFDLVHGACPFPGNIKPQDATLNLEAKKPETVNLEATKPETVNPEAKKPESVNSEAKKPGSVNPEAKKPENVKPAPSRPRFGLASVCFRGNMKNHPALYFNSPPCWYREKQGYYSCYELDPKTKKCPDFPNRVKRPLTP